MTIGDAASVVALVVDLIALKFLIDIRNDDREMKIMQRESLEAQKEFWERRLKWYETRTKKKDNDIRPTVGDSSNGL